MSNKSGNKQRACLLRELLALAEDLNSKSLSLTEVAESLYVEREALVRKKYDGGLSVQEDQQLTMVREKLDRVEQARQQSVLLANSVGTLGRLARARDFMKAAHGSQLRKHTGEPYWHHPDLVAQMVAEVGGSEDMVIAALLHDVVEDTSVTLPEIESEFGPVVSSLVEQLTDVSKPSDGNRVMRKALDLIHTQKASPEAHTIKLADILDNLPSIIANDPQFATVYVPEKMFLSRVLGDGDRKLFERLQKVFEKYVLAHPDMQDVYDTALEVEGIWTPRHREKRL